MPSTPLISFTQLKLEPIRNPDLARTIEVLLKPSTTFLLAVVLGEITATPGVYSKFDPNAADGLQYPKVILAYAGTTDANGLITGMVGAFPNLPLRTLPAYNRGKFDCATVNMGMGDSGALLQAALNVPGFGHLVEGSAAAGSFQIG